jgi:hypothetical protein
LREVEVVERVGQNAVVLEARVEAKSSSPAASGGVEVKRTVIGNKSYVKVYIPYFRFSRPGLGRA